MRIRILAAVSALAIVVGFGAPAAASAHVHGITPLRCLGENPIAGGIATDDTPAGGESGPISGLIPRDTGSAALTIGDGGFDAAPCN